MYTRADEIMEMENLILKLYEIEAVKFGNFTLKSGISSPIYFDLRVIISYPDIMKDVSDHMWRKLQDVGCQYKTICGVPYTALPIATCVSASHNIPMLIRRKEAKDYGTKKLIEGRFEAGDLCLIIEDVVTSGSSVLETAQSLTDVGLKVTDAIVLLDRGQGGIHHLKDHGITLHSVCDVHELLTILQNHGKLSPDVISQVKTFISENNTYNPVQDGKLMEGVQSIKQKPLSYGDRAALCDHPLSRELLTLMEEKRTNLALSADVVTSKELLDLADTLGPYICVLKTHIDILNDYTQYVSLKLRVLAAKHRFIIFEDRKFADIGSTVRQQLCGGVHGISKWADLVNAHALPGPGVIQGLQQAISSGDHQCRGCLLIAEMSSKGNLAGPEYSKKVVEMAKQHKDFVIGFICQSRVSDDPTLIHMTPGVKLESGGDSLGQQYATPADVITRRRCDIIIVGRGITESGDPAYTAKQYQEAGYSAYLAQFQ